MPLVDDPGGMLDLIFPPACPLCARFLSVDERDLCLVCGPHLNPRRVSASPSEHARYVGGTYESRMRRAVHRLKYHGEVWRAPPLGRALARALYEHLEGAELVLPVPLTPRRLRERGYNQSAGLARGVRAICGGRYRPTILARSGSHGPQAERDAEQRKLVHGTIKVVGDVRGRHVIVVDDVTTTGNTLAACAGPLRDCGALSVTSLALTFTLPQPGSCATPHDDRVTS